MDRYFTKKELLKDFKDFLQDNSTKKVTFKVIDNYITFLHYDILDNISDMQEYAEITRYIINTLTKHYEVKQWKIFLL